MKMRGRIPIIAFACCLSAFLGLSLFSAVSNADRWLTATNRLPNVRILAPACRAATVQRFLDLRAIGPGTLLIFGDSQAFASSVDDDRVWPRLVASEMGLSEINLSVLDGRPGDSQYIAELVERSGQRAGISIVNMNLSHFESDQLDLRHVPHALTSVAWYAVCAVRARRLFNETQPPLPSDGNTHSRFVGGNLPRSYFDADPATIRTALTPMLQSISRTANRSVSFVAPARLASFDRYKFDRSQYNRSIAEISEACHSSGINQCVEDTSGKLTPDAFYDIVHLTERGHKDFSRILLDSLNEQGKAPPGPTLSLTFDHYSTAYEVAFPIMRKYGLTGTFYVDPRAIDRGVEGIRADQLAEMERAGWEVGIYSGFRMDEFFAREGGLATREKFLEMFQIFVAKGFAPRSFAPASRAWSKGLRDLSEGIFANVRVSRSPHRIRYPIKDWLYVDGGGMASLTHEDSEESLVRVVDKLVEEGGLQPVVVHRIGDDRLAIGAERFEAFCDLIARRKAGGLLRVLPFTEALR